MIRQSRAETLGIAREFPLTSLSQFRGRAFITHNENVMFPNYRAITANAI